MTTSARLIVVIQTITHSFRDFSNTHIHILGTKNVALTHMKFYDEGVGYDVFLADTPGFDDTDPNKDDTTVLRNIAEWLGLLHLGNKKLAGIIYLQTITADRITGSMSRNLEMLKGLVGADKMANVVMVTTRWEKVVSAHEITSTAPELPAASIPI